VAYAGVGLVAKVLDSKAVGVGLVYVLPGLFLFAINKVGLARVNAHRHMRAFAVFQAGRFVLYLGVLAAMIVLKTDGDVLPVMFSVGEAILFVGVMAYIALALPSGPLKDVGGWCRRHLSFGSRAAGGNVLLDMNTRVDVLILGLFVSDARVGIYSFAAILADGFNQLSVVLRTNANPILAQTFAQGGGIALAERVRRGVCLAYRFLVPIGLLALACFPVLFLVGVDRMFLESWWLLAMLMAGSLLAAGYLPFQMILGQTGHPGAQTCVIAILFLTNVVLNVALIPWLGAAGAAAATAIALGTHVLCLKAFVHRVLDIRI
jgi:O-antigen/teichoic acid export membrane protein